MRAWQVHWSGLGDCAAAELVLT